MTTPRSADGGQPMFEAAVTSLPRIAQGKVRDLYEVGDDHVLIVATDRLSAFDVVLPDPIPGKGRVLTALSNFWFARTHHLVPNHLASMPLAAAVPDPIERAPLEGRAVIARRLEPLPLEAVVRGYLIGSGWKDYQATGRISGVALPPGLRLADRLAEPIFTPASKAGRGAHDQNIGFEDATALIGGELASRVRQVSVALYADAARHAAERGIIIADTKFEFAVEASGRLVLIDEVLTPDSSRFWPVAGYRPGISPPSFDKQYVRDYLETLDWDKRPPGPRLPEAVVRRTSEKYAEALRALTAPQG
ncbi:MAG TPA: phosphoribosylaminoimidazolesuccinocarboxamide synthase [Gammaproteobacteria bacterium]|nr:phosphoribosylaminoimidazolesuccinocarboxamide synthase [Gammaproteobacteria bacterium]